MFICIDDGALEYQIEANFVRYFPSRTLTIHKRVVTYNDMELKNLHLTLESLCNQFQSQFIHVARPIFVYSTY